MITAGRRIQHPRYSCEWVRSLSDLVIIPYFNNLYYNKKQLCILNTQKSPSSSEPGLLVYLSYFLKEPLSSGCACP